MLRFVRQNLPVAMAMAMAMVRAVLATLTLASLLWTCAVAAQVSSLDEARRLLREGQVDSALVVIEQRLAADSTDRHARFLKGVALAEKPDTDAAIEVFVALTRDHPQLPEPYNNLAVLYATKGDYERARDALLQAINTHPSYATAHENLGDIYAKMAGLAYTRALSLDTANVAAKDKLALIDDLFAAPVAGTVATSPVIVAAAPAPIPAPAPRAANEAVQVAASSRASTAPPPAETTIPVTEAEVNDVIDTVQSWARAWASQDIPRYLEHYVARVSPDASMNRRRWEQRRRVRLSKPGSIFVDVGNFKVRRESNERVTVTFEQGYRSDSYSDRVRKRLTMKRLGNSWKISDERTIAKL